MSFNTRLILPVLLLSTFLGVSLIVFYSTLLVDMASTFNVPIGTASQLNLVTNVVGLFLGIAMGALTLKFNHKTLFLAGVALYGLGSLGLFFAPNFLTAVLVNLIIGIGGGMMEIMVFSLIGDLIPLKNKGSAIGLVFAVTFLAFVLIGPLSGRISEIAGWRFFLVFFTLPTSLICFVWGILAIPNQANQKQNTTKPKYSDALKQIFLNKSASVCLLCTALFSVFNNVPIYLVSFYRVTFSVTPFTGGMFTAIAAAGGILGGIAGGRLVNSYGRKTLTVAGIIVSAVFAFLITLVPIVWLSVAVWAINASFAAFAMAAMSSLVLEQVPTFRASMVSTNNTFRATGTILGVGIGGLVLNIFTNNFQLLMGIFSGSAIAGAVIMLLCIKDPCRL